MLICSDCMISTHTMNTCQFTVTSTCQICREISICNTCICIDTDSALNAKLKSLLQQMEIPPDRFEDIRWLNRNMGIRNSKHSSFPLASKILGSLLRSSFK